MNTDPITCTKVDKLERYIPLELGSTVTKTSGKKCSTNQTSSDFFPVCGVVNSNYQEDNDDKSLEKLYCSLFKNNTIEEENSTYSCEGHREYNNKLEYYGQLSNTGSLYDRYNEPYTTGYITFVKNEDINNLRNYISAEQNSRIQHQFYKYDSGISAINERLKDVNDEEHVIDIQQNRLLSILTDIKSSIYNDKDYKYTQSYEKIATNVIEKDLIETSNLREIEQDVYNTGVDCICYSDCTNFQLAKKCYCTCNINCNCNYS